jgi:hypothetical protein
MCRVDLPYFVVRQTTFVIKLAMSPAASFESSPWVVLEKLNNSTCVSLV